MSDMEDEDPELRRKLRGEQRSINDAMYDNMEELEKPESDLYKQIRDTVNEQFERTTHSREQLLDAENLKILSYVTKTQASKINNSSGTYNFSNFADAIRQGMQDPETFSFSWEKLGRMSCPIFRSTPSYMPLNGPIGKGYVAKERKKTEKPRDNNATLAKAENVTQGDEEDDKVNEATNERITKLRYILAELTRGDEVIDNFILLVVHKHDLLQNYS
jgi:hypothetical protein